jgi:hypothetical protein
MPAATDEKLSTPSLIEIVRSGEPPEDKESFLGAWLKQEEEGPKRQTYDEFRTRASTPGDHIDEGHVESALADLRHTIQNNSKILGSRVEMGHYCQQQSERCAKRAERLQAPAWATSEETIREYREKMDVALNEAVFWESMSEFFGV